MNNPSRRWSVQPVDSLRELARSLCDSAALPLCAGFELDRHLFLCDSESREPREFAVVKRVTAYRFRYLASVQFDDCSETSAERFLIAHVLQTNLERQPFAFDLVEPCRVEPPDEHVSCSLCRPQPTASPNPEPSIGAQGTLHFL